MKKFLLVVLIVLVILSTLSCNKDESPQYMQIIDADACHCIAVSSMRGIPLIPIVENLQSITITCDKGGLFYCDDFTSIDSMELNISKDEIVYGNTRYGTAYWDPVASKKNGYTDEAIITIEAELKDGKKVSQILYVRDSDESIYTLTDYNYME